MSLSPSIPLRSRIHFAANSAVRLFPSANAWAASDPVGDKAGGHDRIGGADAVQDPPNPIKIVGLVEPVVRGANGVVEGDDQCQVGEPQCSRR